MLMKKSFRFSNIPGLRSNVLCYQQHSRFAGEFSPAILCFHRHSWVVRKIFRVARVSLSFGATTSCPNLSHSPKSPTSSVFLRSWRAAHGLNQHSSLTPYRILAYVTPSVKRRGARLQNSFRWEYQRSGPGHRGRRREGPVPRRLQAA